MTIRWRRTGRPAPTQEVLVVYQTHADENLFHGYYSKDRREGWCVFSERSNQGRSISWGWVKRWVPACEVVEGE